MEPEFWKQRWHEGRTAFHEGTPNAYLAQFHDRVLAGCSRILVPLCGKSEDLAFLAAQGHSVVGVEVVEDAVRQFFAEHGVEPTIDGNVYRAGAITIIASDIFAVTPAIAGDIDGIYDRAAIVALPPAIRDRYVSHLRETLAPNARAELLVAIEHDKGDGPPFSVGGDEVRARFADATVEELGHGVDPRGRPMTERCYGITFAARRP